MRRRPIGITILAVLQIVGGAFSFLLGLALLGVSLYFQSIGLEGPLSSLLGALALVLGLLSLVLGWGYLNAQGWAWTIGIILNLLGLLAASGELAAGNLVFLGGLFIQLIILAYLSTRSVRVYFGQALPLTGEKAQLAFRTNPGDVSSSSITCRRCGSRSIKGRRQCGVCGAEL